MTDKTAMLQASCTALLSPAALAPGDVMNSAQLQHAPETSYSVPRVEWQEGRNAVLYMEKSSGHWSTLLHAGSTRWVTPFLAEVIPETPRKSKAQQRFINTSTLIKLLLFSAWFARTDPSKPTPTSCLHCSGFFFHSCIITCHHKPRTSSVGPEWS